MQAVGVLGIQDKDVFRESLRATLVKDSDDRPVFEELFPLYFGGGGPALQNAFEDMSPDEQEMLKEALESLSGRMQALMDWLTSGEGPTKEELEELANQAGAQWADSPQEGRWVTRRMLQRMGFGRLEEQLQELKSSSPQPPTGLKSNQTIDEVKLESAEAGERIARLEEQLALAQADYENAKTRLGKRFAQQFEQDMQAFLRDLLPVLDNLDRAIQHNPADANAEGVKMTRQMFLSTLDKYGVKSTAVLGQPFDPECHEALGIVEESEFPPGSVAAVEQPGYTYRDKLLRPARVLVTPEE